jgi:sphingolipid 4-desaturase/C4-monooxygenase
MGDSFHWTKETEIHTTRRSELLKKHPEISELVGSDFQQALFCTATVLTQVVMAYLVRDAPWYLLLSLSYLVSGTLNHSLMLALHELAHDNFFPGRLANQLFALFANLPIGFAMAVTFRRYHLLHHSSLGVHLVDMDLPTEFEAQWFRSSFGRLSWLILQPLFYCLRPVLLKPLPVTRWEILNWAAQLAFDAVVLVALGPKSMLYLVMGSLLGTGLHPMSGHFLEHSETVAGQETYSYYGPLNWLTYNVGYHNEHHDFPRIPGSKLPLLKSVASSTYANLPYYDSWCVLLWNFVVSGKTNLYSRFKRL